MHAFVKKHAATGSIKMPLAYNNIFVANILKKNTLHGKILNQFILRSLRHFKLVTLLAS